MTWKELRSRIDKAVKQSGKKPDEVEVWYIDIDPDDSYKNLIDINVKDKHHPGQFEPLGSLEEKQMPEEISEELRKQFLLELTALSNKFGITINGCGCCGSPWLAPDKTTGQYNCDENDNLNWEITNTVYDIHLTNDNEVNKQKYLTTTLNGEEQ